MEFKKNPETRRITGRAAWAAACGLFLMFATAACDGTPAMLRPASVNAAQVSNLTYAIFAIAAVVFIVVEAMLLYVTFRYRGRRGQGLPKQVAENIPLEIGWTVFPAVVLAVVYVLTLGTLRNLSISPAPAQAAGPQDPNKVLHVRVIGHMWWWEFQYPDLNITTANELHVPVGATLNMDIETADVLHSFWIPEMGGKMDAISGHVNHIWYQVTKPGRMQGQCAEFCGIEHAMMRMQVVADPPDQFAAWVKDQQAVPPQPTDPKVALGQSSFYGMPCGTCHTIAGAKANGKIGPDLTHFASRATFAGGSFDNNRENLRRWLENPQALKPGNKMPNLGTTPAVADQLIDYLETLK